MSIDVLGLKAAERAAAQTICKILQTGAAASNYMDQSYRYWAESLPCISSGLHAPDCSLPTPPQSGMHGLGTDRTWPHCLTPTALTVGRHKVPFEQQRRGDAAHWQRGRSMAGHPA